MFVCITAAGEKQSGVETQERAVLQLQDWGMGQRGGDPAIEFSFCFGLVGTASGRVQFPSPDPRAKDLCMHRLSGTNPEVLCCNQVITVGEVIILVELQSAEFRLA